METRHQTRAPSLHELHGARGGEIMSCEHLLEPAAHGSMGLVVQVIYHPAAMGNVLESWAGRTPTMT